MLISGLTVMLAMAGMFLTGDKTFGSFAMATIMVVAIAVLGSLTVLPALLSRLGDRVNKARVPLLHRLQRPGGGRVWGWTLDRVLRRPLVSVVVSAGDPRRAGAARAGDEDRRARRRGAPAGPEAVQVYDRLQARVPGRADARRRRRQGAVDRRPARSRRRSPSLRARARRERAASTSRSPSRSTQARTVARIELPIAGTGSDDDVVRRDLDASRRGRPGDRRLGSTASRRA